MADTEPAVHNQQPNQRRTRRATLIIAAIAVVAIIAAIVGIIVWPRPAYEGPAITSARSAGASVTQQNKGPLTSTALPFSVDGVPANGDVVEVTEGAQSASLGDSWTFGGDFSQIGSLPVSANTVFGSSTTNPDDLRAYYAAFINRGENAGNAGSNMANDHSATAQNIDPDAQSGTFYEPQDGTGDANRVVWRSSTMNTVAQNNVDNWRLQTWNKADGKAATLGTAKDLNGRDDTPPTYGEVVPTFNQRNAYFAANVFKDNVWQESILQYSLDLSGGSNTDVPRIVALGNFPAAIDNGVIFATDAAQKNDFRAYATLKHDNGTQTSTIFTVHSANNAWGIAGVWAHGAYRAVAFSDGTQQSGNYIGLWADDFKTNLGWIHVKSASVVASMNNDWIVWGSGSQADNAGMYAFNWQRFEVEYLGAVQGYSRPTIASDSNTVMVPKFDGTTKAVTFTIGTLQ